jgi:hypothetical protein
MKTNHNGYSIETYNVGQSFGTEALVKRGNWSEVTPTYPLGSHDRAAEAAKAIADRHAAYHAAT